VSKADVGDQRVLGLTSSTHCQDTQHRWSVHLNVQS